MSKMNPEWKAKWVAALRSGEYKQGKSRLKHGGRYCCLGVLADITGCKIKREYLVLPYDVVDLTGVEESGALGVAIEVAEVGISSLAGLNDGAGYTFEQIADVIEEYL